MDGDKIIQISGIIGDPKSWKVNEYQGEELVLVPIPGGRGGMIKMRKSEAIAKGLWKEEEAEKAQPPAKNKQRRPMTNKAGEQGSKGAGEHGSGGL